MKFIEPGCLAMILPGETNTEDVGKIVRVIRSAGSHPEFSDGSSPDGCQGPCWEIDRSVVWKNSDGYVWREPFCPQMFLQRLDDFDFSKEQQEEAYLDHVQEVYNRIKQYNPALTLEGVKREMDAF